MGLHSDFRLMVRALYDQARVHVKVNGVVSDGFSPRHGLHQGCPCSPVLYLLCLQTFMSLMATDDGEGDPTRRLRGIQLPQRDGTEEDEAARKCIHLLVLELDTPVVRAAALVEDNDPDEYF